MNRLPNTDNCSKHYATETSATVETQDSIDTDSSNVAPVLRKKYSMQCIPEMPQEVDKVITHNKADTKPEVLVSHVPD